MDMTELGFIVNVEAAVISFLSIPLPPWGPNGNHIILSRKGKENSLVAGLQILWYNFCDDFHTGIKAIFD